MQQQTSLEAYERIKPDLPEIKSRVWAYVFANDGATSYEIESSLNLKHATVSAALTKLKQASLVYDSGERRKTDTGNNAIVWKVAPDGYTAEKEACCDKCGQVLRSKDARERLEKK